MNEKLVLSVLTPAAARMMSYELRVISVISIKKHSATDRGKIVLLALMQC
jgi:hypothetical protein